MKNIVWIVMAAFTTSLSCGCGTSTHDNGQAKAPPSSLSPQQAGPVAVAASGDTSDPQQAVTRFLDALKAGDKTTTEEMLTTKARQETAAHDLVVQPPGAPNANYTIGRVQVAEEEAEACVSCVWSETDQQTEFEVVWYLRRETTGWRIAGMATQLDGEDVFLNFEDLSEFEEAMQSEQVADQQNTVTQPPPTTVR